MVERDEICLRKRKIKRKVKMGGNEGEIKGLTMNGLERERGGRNSVSGRR